MFDKYIDNYKEEIINTVCETIKFKSISEENLSSINPFGEDCSNILEYVLNIGKSFGFKTKNLDNYCGYIEFGEGKELVGIIGHLDVVPAEESDGWTFPPFTPSVHDGKIFGRGSIDDKGPVIASLYAMKAVFDNSKVNKRVRLILGLNEEKNWECINYYKKHEEFPNVSFSPDANFPGIYAEKGIISVELKHPFYINNAEIINIDCNNNAINVVPKFASITLKINNNSFLNNLLSSNNKFEDIEIKVLENNIIKIISYGIASHAAHPELGKNAITNLVEFLLKNFEFNDNYLSKMYNIGLFSNTSPSIFNNNVIEDESGILTSNVAILEYIEKKLIIKILLMIVLTLILTVVTLEL